ncbi:MAG: RidA family protein [Bacteroidota bacterium]|jgi:2-iminobutanoate/2-iminopropanoate deaminase
MKTIVHTNSAPAAIGPYSQAVKAGNMLFTSGQIALHPESGSMINQDITSETKQVMSNLEAVLKAAGTDFSKVIKVSIFLRDLNDFEVVNRVYGSFFDGQFPARETVQVARLPKDAGVEISMIALV